MNINQSWPVRNTSVNQNLNSINKAFKNDTKSFNKTISQISAQKSGATNNSRVDKIEISSASQPQTVSSSFDINKLKDKILADINKETSPEKINEISNKLESDSYSVNSSEVAKLILKI